MSESKFVPGPWCIIGQFEDKIYHEASDTVVAQAWYPGASSKSPSPADTMKANASLIAAAPDMYEALSKVFALLFDETHPDVVISRNDLRDLLAKARGEV